MAQKIKFTGIPPGQAPDWVRKEWVGVEVPLIEGPPEPGILMGVKGGRPDPRSLGGYHVTASDAFTALRVKSPKAAEWWDKNFPAAPGRELVFARDVCELVK